MKPQTPINNILFSICTRFLEVIHALLLLVHTEIKILSCILILQAQNECNIVHAILNAENVSTGRTILLIEMEWNAVL